MAVKKYENETSLPWPLPPAMSPHSFMFQIAARGGVLSGKGFDYLNFIGELYQGGSPQYRGMPDETLREADVHLEATSLLLSYFYKITG
jgi:hypothetical protein